MKRKRERERERGIKELKKWKLKTITKKPFSLSLPVYLDRRRPRVAQRRARLQQRARELQRGEGRGREGRALRRWRERRRGGGSAFLRSDRRSGVLGAVCGLLPHARGVLVLGVVVGGGVSFVLVVFGVELLGGGRRGRRRRLGRGGRQRSSSCGVSFFPLRSFLVFFVVIIRRGLVRVFLLFLGGRRAGDSFLVVVARARVLFVVIVFFVALALAAAARFCSPAALLSALPREPCGDLVVDGRRAGRAVGAGVGERACFFGGEGERERGGQRRVFFFSFSFLFFSMPCRGRGCLGSPPCF